MTDAQDPTQQELQQILAELQQVRGYLATLAGTAPAPGDGAAAAAKPAAAAQGAPVPELAALGFPGEGTIKHAVKGVVNDAINPVKHVVDGIEGAVGDVKKTIGTVEADAKKAADFIDQQLSMAGAIEDEVKSALKADHEKELAELGVVSGLVSNAAHSMEKLFNLGTRPIEQTAHTVAMFKNLAKEGLALDAKIGKAVKAEIEAVGGDLKTAGSAVMDALGQHIDAFKAPADGKAPSAERAAFTQLSSGIDKATSVLGHVPDELMAPLAVALPGAGGGKSFDLVKTAADALKNAAEAIAGAKPAPAPAPAPQPAPAAGFAEAPGAAPTMTLARASDAEIAVKSIIYGLGVIGGAVTAVLDVLTASFPLTITVDAEAGVAAGAAGGVGIGSDIVAILPLILGSISALLTWLISALQTFPLDLIFR